MTITQKLIPSSKHGLKSPYPMTPKFITIHNTANDASALNEIAYMTNNTSSTSFHYAVDDIHAVQGLPLNRNGWHAGDGTDGVGNRQSIGIEICYSKSGGTRFAKAEQNAVLLTAKLLKDYGWGIDRVKKHQDWSGKYCPHRTLSQTGWQTFLNRVQTELNKLNNPKPEPKPEPNTSEGVYKLDNAQKFMVDNKIMKDEKWSEPAKRSEIAWWLFTMYQRGLFGSGVQKAPTPAPAPTVKSINTIAKEVIAGQWGTGQDRINRLTQAGYDYNAVQAEVNRLLGG